MSNARLLFVSCIAAAGLAVSLAVYRSASATGAEPQLNPQDPRSAAFAVDCAAPAKPISPLIYGIGGNDNPWATGTTAVRMGGNPTTRYNWQLDTWNAANDWFFKNTGGAAPGHGHESWLANVSNHGGTA